MEKFKVVCFDMDGTLITNTNSVAYLCTLNGRTEEVKEIEKREVNDKISWIDADYIKAELIAGLPVQSVEDRFKDQIKLINNIEKVLEELRNNHISSILVTAGPIQVAQVLEKIFKFDRVYGSIYETKNDVFTGKILRHLGDGGKLDSLISFCNENNIDLDEVASVGDSASDITVFEKSGKSIAINYSSKLVGKADVYIKTDDLYNVLDHIIQ